MSEIKAVAEFVRVLLSIAPDALELAQKAYRKFAIDRGYDLAQLPPIMEAVAVVNSEVDAALAATKAISKT